MHCLNLKLTYKCTNNCSFCFSSYLKDEIISTKGLFQAVERGSEYGCNELVLSGGEPTTCPDKLCGILSFAAEHGYKKYIIQSNGSGIAENAELTNYIRRFAVNNDLTISFSVHGHTAKIHDTMSQTPGAFDKLMKAIAIISTTTNCGIYTNTVISSLNIDHLKDIWDLLQPYHPVIIQYSMMHLEKSGEMSTGLLEAAAAVRAMKTYVDLDILKTEGIPYCLMYGMEQCVGESCWPNELDLYNKNEDYMRDFNQLEDGMRWKRDDCSKCIMNEICSGIWKEHAEEFAKSSIHPIEA